MREFKFRAWVKPEDIFANHGDIKTGIMFTGFSFNDIQSGRDEANVFCSDNKIWEEPNWEKAIIMRFTGLKDKNGIDIYEGDILKHESYCNFELSGAFVDVVEWGETGDSDGYAHGKHFEYVCGGDSLADIYETSEIIGNIYENPELVPNYKHD